jgi:hypothetical protein
MRTSSVFHVGAYYELRSRGPLVARLSSPVQIRRAIIPEQQLPRPGRLLQV